ncbi:hypothetical protein ACFQVC_23910 [Streptomyces monticola]|uniref:Uncharacterized protein n=1 Tax=Streptomyces monticola TaxID=2666263 RepID=A0ABW2JN93_9ACTN
MSRLVAELVSVLQVITQVEKLLDEEQEHLGAVYGSARHAEQIRAGSPPQTLIGIRELHDAARDKRTHLATAIGYLVAGLDDHIEPALRTARFRPLGLPSGIDRMARPLGERTVRALELVKSIADFFDGDVGMHIEVCLAASAPTYPPKDWTSYQH